MQATQVPGKRNNNLEIRIAGSSDRLQIAIRPASDLIPETPSSCWICLRWEITTINSVCFILPLLAIVFHVIKHVTGFGTHVGILSFKRLTPNEYILLCNRVRTLWALQIPWPCMTFSITFSRFPWPCVLLSRSKMFKTFHVSGYFLTLNSSTDTNSGVHQNVCLSRCLITPLYLTLTLLSHLQ